MPARISEPGARGPLLRRTPRKAVETAPTQQDVRSAAAAPRVVLDARSGELNRIALAAPEVDRALVERIRHTLERGVYRIEPHRIADKLVAFEWNLGRARVVGPAS